MEDYIVVNIKSKINIIDSINIIIYNNINFELLKNKLNEEIVKKFFNESIISEVHITTQSEFNKKKDGKVVIFKR